MFLELESENIFRQKYFEVLKYRLAYGSLELEGISEDLAGAKQALNVFNQLEAINYIFDNHKNEYLNHLEFTNLLCGVADKINGGEINNFRNIEIMVNNSNVPRTKPQMIRNDLWYLIDDYNYQIQNCKTEREILEVEAQFHIRLLHIHPFEDGNGRTARIFLLYNLCKHNIAPFIITKEYKRKYCDLIENADYKGLADMFEKLSHQELKVMISLYKDLDQKGCIDSNKMTEEQEKKYKSLMKKQRV